MSRMDVDEEDPVVRELPVYLSLELTHQLYLLQYPLRAAGRPYDQGGVTPVSCAFYLDASMRRSRCSLPGVRVAPHIRGGTLARRERLLGWRPADRWEQ